MRKEMRMLIDDAELSLFRRKHGHRSTSDVDGPRRCWNETGNGFEQSRLPGARRSDDHAIGACRHVYRDVSDTEAAARCAHPAERDHRASSSAAGLIARRRTSGTIAITTNTAATGSAPRRPV